MDNIVQVIIDFLTNNPDMAQWLVGFLMAHYGAKITVIVTKTKNSKWYKLAEIIGGIIGRAKDKAYK